MRKKTKYEKKTFESDCSSSDVSANIYLSMLTSPAFMDLSNGQKVLYLYCKSQYYAEKKAPNPGNAGKLYNESIKMERVI